MQSLQEYVGVDVCRRISGVDTSGFGCTVTLLPVVSRTASPFVRSRPHIYDTKSQEYEDQFHMICTSKYASAHVARILCCGHLRNGLPSHDIQTDTSPQSTHLGRHGNSWSQVSGEYRLAYTYTLYWRIPAPFMSSLFPL